MGLVSGVAMAFLSEFTRNYPSQSFRNLQRGGRATSPAPGWLTRLVLT
jgi:hypothetical protein